MAEIFRLDLTQDLIPEPLNAYRVDENKYGIADLIAEPNRPFMVAYPLLTCRALIFHNPEFQRGLIAHIGLLRDLQRTMNHLVSNFNVSLKQSAVFLVSGYREIRRTEGSVWQAYSLDEIAEEVNKHESQALFVDNHQTERPRGISLDLRNGELKELDSSNGWTWSKEHNTQINRSLYELYI